MNLQGEISVRIAWDGRQASRVESRSSRPDVAASVLTGRGTTEAIALVTRLFPLCGRAQGIAAALACEAARGMPASQATGDARARIVDAEHLAECLWHELLDTPMLLGEPGSTRVLAAARATIDRAIAGDGQAAPGACASHLPVPTHRESWQPPGWPTEVFEAARHVFGEDPTRWFSRWGDSIEAWARTASSPSARMLAEIEAGAAAFGNVPAHLLPELDARLATRTIAVAMDADPSFARSPVWNGLPAETGAICTYANHGWISRRIRDGHLTAARIGARLLDLAALLGGAPRPERFGSAQVSDGDGIAWVRTARGMLIHRVELREGRVARWRIIAPTEWNFHPQGALADALRSRHADTPARLERLAALVVHSLDPCVACAVEVCNA